MLLADLLLKQGEREQYNLDIKGRFANLQNKIVLESQPP